MKLANCILVIAFAIIVKTSARDEVKRFAYDLSTHVLDVGKGRPAANVPVALYKLKSNDAWTFVTQGLTEESGRLSNFASNTEAFTAGTYRLLFDTNRYYSYTDEKTLYPVVEITFNVDNPKEHYHIPILLNAYGYTTYRGS